MTALASALGMVPLVIGTGAGKEINSSTAGCGGVGWFIYLYSVDAVSITCTVFIMNSKDDKSTFTISIKKTQSYQRID